MKVSDETKKSYKSDTSHKTVEIEFPALDRKIGNSQIWEQGGINLKESLMEGGTVEFVGCIASSFSATLEGVNDNIKNQYIKVSIKTDKTEKIPIFSGYIDSVARQTDRSFKKIIAYDVLHKKSDKNIARWYNALIFPASLGDIRNSLFQHLGIAQEQISLPNDDIVIKKEYKPSSLKAIDVIKAICQINGVFGIINRSEKFEYRIPKELVNAESGAYPGPLFFPGAAAYPGVDRTQEQEKAEHIAYYQKVDYEEYTVKPVDKVTIRQSDQEEGVSYGSGENNYIIQGNMFTRNLSESALLKIAQNIYDNVQGIEFCPFTSNNNGLPYLEVGKDKVSFYVLDDEDNYVEKTFYVFSRELKGGQDLMDTYQAAGDEYQREFVTDLRLQIETIKQNITTEVEREVKKITYDKDEIDRLEERIRILEENQQKWVSVDSLPEHPDPGTWYVIRGEAVVG